MTRGDWGNGTVCLAPRLLVRDWKLFVCSQQWYWLDLVRVYCRPVNLSSEFRNVCGEIVKRSDEVDVCPCWCNRQVSGQWHSLVQTVERLRTEVDELVVLSSDEGTEPDVQEGDIEYFSWRLSESSVKTYICRDLPEQGPIVVVVFSWKTSHLFGQCVRKCVRMVWNFRELLLSIFSCRNLSQL